MTEPTVQMNCPARHREDRVRVGCPVWCPGHFKAIILGLRQAPSVAEWLMAEQVERTETVQRSPIAERSASAAGDNLEELGRWLYDWAVIAAQHLHHVGPTMDNLAGLPDLGASIERGSRYLLAQSDSILNDPGFPPEFGVEGIVMFRRLDHWLRQDDPLDHLHAPCPACDRVGGLVRENGSSQVGCSWCSNVWPESDYQRLVKILLS